MVCKVFRHPPSQAGRLTGGRQEQGSAGVVSAGRLESLEAGNGSRPVACKHRYLLGVGKACRSFGGGGAQGAGAGTGQELEQERTGKAEIGAAETGQGRNRKRYGDGAGRRSAKSRGCSYSCGLFFSPGRRLAAPWRAYMAFLSEPFLSLPFLSVLVPATAFLLTSLLYCSRAFSSLEASSVGTSSPCLPWVSRRSVR